LKNFDIGSHAHKPLAEARWPDVPAREVAQIRRLAGDGKQAQAPSPDLSGRVFVMLQGPPGPFFHLLGERMRALGAKVYRINFNGGDRYDWPGEGAIDYRGRFSKWPRFFDHFLRDNGITDVMLFGDCRPMHRAAHGMAKLRKIDIHVFEEGYIRPDWVTMELDGVNGNSTLPKDPQWFLDQARDLPPLEDLPPITASFNRRVRDSYWYFHHVVINFWRFPYYRLHRPGNIIVEGLGWVWKLKVRQKRAARQTEETLKALEGKKYFLFPLQLSSDYQIREHSPFADMHNAAHYVFDSFAMHAPEDCYLLVKEHPLDASYASWRKFIEQEAQKRGLGDRLMHIAGGDLAALAQDSVGMVTVNSTSGTFALAAGVPVKVLGSAIYDVPGVTHVGGLDGYWQKPQPPVETLYRSFKSVLRQKCLVRGGFASKSGVSDLISSVETRLLHLLIR
jgi:capsular polysaccharide export protein